MPSPPVILSLPRPPFSVSAPLPPTSVSLPSAPVSVSSPSSPVRTLASALPMRVSLKFDPRRLVMPVRISPSACPPDPTVALVSAIFTPRTFTSIVDVVLRLIVTPAVEVS
ncbi:hypothetical protein C7I84_13760 [Mesorhizobium ephedrae]|uniref:Uncharacterized protein n=1 Tax=Kumtagia ephedrae TaxID=2116701 RepID=A0A2P7S9B4_9HYPH|nr:hypothetical protein C7I84_13760 [Mesorhizobium ephedrae]